MTGGRTAIVAVVAGNYYEACAPLFARFALDAMPDSVVVLCFRRAAPTALRRSMNRLGVDADRVRLVERLGVGAPHDAKSTKMLRWTLGEDVLGGSRFAWIGDVDILVVPETPNLAEQHAAHARSLGLPYSNVLLRNRDGPMLSGLHFIEVGPYLAAVGKSARRALRAICSGEAQRRWMRDRHLLHHVIASSGLGLPKVDATKARSEAKLLPPSSPYFRPHHGPHLRLWSPGVLAKTAKLRSSAAYQDHLARLPREKIDRLLRDGIVVDQILLAQLRALRRDLPC